MTLLIQSEADEPWRVAMSSGAEVSKLPEALPPGTSSTPSAADNERAIAVVEQVATFLETGRSENLLDVSAKDDGRAIWTERVRRLKSGKGGLFDVTVLPYTGDRYVTGAAGTVRVVRAKTGLLVVSSYRLSTMFHASPDNLAFVPGAYGEMTGQTLEDGHGDVTEERVAAVLTFVPDQGKPQVLGGDLTFVVPEKVKARK
ncbi:MAG: hypothetical protein ACK5MP_10785 [Nostocoides sp.]